MLRYSGITASMGRRLPRKMPTTRSKIDTNKPHNNCKKEKEEEFDVDQILYSIPPKVNYKPVSKAAAIAKEEEAIARVRIMPEGESNLLKCSPKPYSSSILMADPAYLKATGNAAPGQPSNTGCTYSKINNENNNHSKDDNQDIQINDIHQEAKQPVFFKSLIFEKTNDLKDVFTQINPV